MIHGMRCCETILIILCFSLELSASGNTRSSIALQSTPELNAFVYGFPGVSLSILEAAETQAAWILGDCPLDLMPSSGESLAPPLPPLLFHRKLRQPVPNGLRRIGHHFAVVVPVLLRNHRRPVMQQSQCTALV